MYATAFSIAPSTGAGLVPTPNVTHPPLWNGARSELTFRAPTAESLPVGLTGDSSFLRQRRRVEPARVVSHAPVCFEPVVVPPGRQPDWKEVPCPQERPQQTGFCPTLRGLFSSRADKPADDAASASATHETIRGKRDLEEDKDFNAMRGRRDAGSECYKPKAVFSAGGISISRKKVPCTTATTTEPPAATTTRSRKGEVCQVEQMFPRKWGGNAFPQSGWVTVDCDEVDKGPCPKLKFW